MRIITFCILVAILTSCSRKTSISSLEQFRAKTLQEHFDDQRSPIKPGDEVHMHYFDEDPSWALDCTFEREKVNNEAFEMATFSGITTPYRIYGQVTCPSEHGDIQLEIYQHAQIHLYPQYIKNLFLPYKDHTNGESSYGGGRYIKITTDDIANGKIHVDFNKSYNPWCAYSDGYNCPIPPMANHLDVAIEAGESKYTGPKKQRQK